MFNNKIIKWWLYNIFLILDYNEIMLYDPLKYLNPILEECNEDIRSTIIFTKSFLF